jgi:mono/diheme cytochrome c family protein
VRLFVAAALVALTALAAGCGTEGLPDEGNASRGKEVFTSAEGQCGACHELADAGTKGQVGPNLDEAFAASREEGFKKSTIAAVVLDQIYYPTAGSGMPAKLVEGEDAEAVANYVADVAGDPEAIKAAAPPPPSKGGKPDGKAIFASAGCATCHTLAAAGATGTVGPNLDQAKPSVDTAIERITQGKGVMPSFKGQLSAAEIRAVAEFVSNSSRKN